MRSSTTKLYNWSLHKASSSHATFWLAFLFSLELIFFIPLDAVLMFFCLQKRKNILLYITIATVCSTISGLIGYLLGHFLWDIIGNWVVPHVLSTNTFARMSHQMQTYENWAVFFGSLVPFPLKALSLVAGVFQLGIIPFVTCLALARLIRFSLIGASMAIWGEKVKLFVDRHFHRLFLIVGAKLALATALFWMFTRG